jgi:sorbitol-specific phosphotransferase system component IIBC
MLPSADADTGTLAARPLGPVSLALWISGLRCVATYVVLPFLAPVLGATIVLAIPIVLALYALGIGASARALWRSAQRARWLAAGFAAMLLALNLLSLVTVLGQRL